MKDSETETRSPAPRILVAEDDDEMRALLTRALSRRGFQVTEAEDGFELADCLNLSLLSGHLSPPDLLLVDVHMPGRSGLEVVAQARAAGLRCPVAVLSAFVDELTAEDARRMGVDLVLDKPVDLENLGARMRELLALRPAP